MRSSSHSAIFLSLFISSLHVFPAPCESFAPSASHHVRVRVRAPGVPLKPPTTKAEAEATVTQLSAKLKSTEKESTTSTTSTTSSIDPQLINDFCQSTNNFWAQLVIPPIKTYVQTRPAFSAKSDPISKLTAPPEIPGIPRPVWLTILGSVPTALGWYGYYKFSVEEELYQYELQNGEMVTGCGGYGTLLPFVFGVIIGFPMQFLHIPGGGTLVEASALWILLGQVNLYRRVNDLCDGAKEELGLTEEPLYGWWALLPPPLDVVVGLRQVHFLSEFWRIKRGEEYDKDIIAEELFPFISSERFTLKEFVTEPKRWFWFTKKWKDIELKL